MQMVVICTFANYESPGLRNWQATMHKFGHEPVVLGMGKPWQGWLTRTQEYFDYVQTLSPATVVVLIDAFDALACRSPEGLLETYLSFGKPLVISTENICNKLLNCRPITQWWQQTLQPKNKYQYVNAGFMIGTAEGLSKTLDFILKSKIQDDQLALCHYVEAYPERVALDTESRLMGTLTMTGWMDFENKYGKLIRKSSQAQPYFLHTPGIRWDFGRRYNTWGHQLLGQNFEPYDALPDMVKHNGFRFGMWILFWILLILLIAAPKVALIVLILVFVYVLFMKLI